MFKREIPIINPGVHPQSCIKKRKRNILTIVQLIVLSGGLSENRLSAGLLVSSSSVDSVVVLAPFSLVLKNSNSRLICPCLLHTDNLP